MQQTVLDLERAIVKAVAIWTADMQFKSPADRGAVPVNLSVYRGHIPSFQTGPSLPSQPKAPSVAIRATHGIYRREEGEADVNFAILTFDDSTDRQGYQDVMNIINRISNGLLEVDQNFIAQSFVLLQDSVHEASIHFELIDDPNVDFFPYWLGGMTARFGIFSPGPDSAIYGDTGSDTMDWTGPNVPTS